MPYFTLNADGIDLNYSADGVEDCLEATIQNHTAINGDRDCGPLSWLNHAGVELKPDDDHVEVHISIGDPRGAFVMRIRKADDGTLILGVPHHNDPHQHTTMKPVHDHDTGVYRVGHHTDSADELANNLTWDQCRTALDSVGIVTDGCGIDEMRAAVAANLKDGTLEFEDIPKE